MPSHNAIVILSYFFQVKKEIYPSFIEISMHQKVKVLITGGLPYMTIMNACACTRSYKVIHQLNQ